MLLLFSTPMTKCIYYSDLGIPGAQIWPPLFHDVSRWIVAHVHLLSSLSELDLQYWFTSWEDFDVRSGSCLKRAKRERGLFFPCLRSLLMVSSSHLSMLTTIWSYYLSSCDRFMCDVLYGGWGCFFFFWSKACVCLYVSLKLTEGKGRSWKTGRIQMMTDYEDSQQAWKCLEVLISSILSLIIWKFGNI